MASGFPIRINGVRVLTSEALYQACRFPHRPEVQRLIIEQTSPMTAKMKGKPYRDDSRPDWDSVRRENHALVPAGASLCTTSPSFLASFWQRAFVQSLQEFPKGRFLGRQARSILGFW